MIIPERQWETSRLTARPPLESDAEIVFEEYACDPLVTRYMTWQPHRSIGDTLVYLRRCEQVWKDGSAYPWSLWLKETGDLAGFVEIRVGSTSVNVGYALVSRHWRKGLMTEALTAVIELCFSQSSIFRVWATCDIDNIASAKVLEKVGMVKEGVLRRWLVHPNLSDKPRDAYCYSIVR
ncbi:MAG: GNAT family N-acetyltransferase [Aridibacter famidurans]|nr:GNAT family N-acetyltransferase [Aridibacter famidurans]